MNRIALSLLALAGLASSAVTSSAQIMLPAGLADGTQFRLIFATSDTIDALSSDISVYNAFVTTEADQNLTLAALDTTWTAVASTGSESVFVNTNTNPDSTGVPIYNTVGHEIAANNAGLWSGSLKNPIVYSQFGTGAGHNGEVWTGLLGDGADFDVLGNSNGQVLFGNDFQTNSAWTDSYEFEPGTELGLYAISGVLTVENGVLISDTAPELVPEPATWALLLFGITGLGAWHFRRVRQKPVCS